MAGKVRCGAQMPVFGGGGSAEIYPVASVELPAERNCYKQRRGKAVPSKNFPHRTKKGEQL